MKAKNLIVGQHCVFIYEGMAGIFQAIERDPNYPDQVPVKEITLDKDIREYPRISCSILGLRLNDKVMPLRGVRQSIA
jgi:hypothetical protein